MGKKIAAILILGCVVFSLCGGQVQAGPAMTAQMSVAVENARDALKAKEWVVYLTPEGARPVGETDVITFTAEEHVSSRNLLVKGYGDSNFRLTVENDGTAVWETMKVDKDKNLVFLRGELRGSQMTGSIFMKPIKGATSTYYYSTASAPAAPATEGAVATKKGKK